MVPYYAAAVLTVASSGKGESKCVQTPYGEMRSRAGAKLKYTTNDVQALYQNTPKQYLEDGVQSLDCELIDPCVDEFYAAVEKAARYLADQSGPVNSKNVLTIMYAGHGEPLDGAWVLKDCTISASELHRRIENSYAHCERRLHVDLIMDSCFSSRFLIDFLIASQNSEYVYAFDCFASSLPEEVSYEFAFLEHGVLSFHLTHQGNKHVDRNELAKAIDKSNQKTILKALHGITVPNPVTYLTAGKQHCVELISGHSLEVQGAGCIKLADYEGTLTRLGLSDALHRAKTAYGEAVTYIGE